MAPPFDLTVVGGGIVGLATALKMLESFPDLKLLVLEKEARLAAHQTGHNSGVIHSGIYYKPGSIKAQTCVTGRKALVEFCDRQGIPYDLCGKVVVATREEELPRLAELHRRGNANGVQGLQMIGPERLKEIEPHANGIQALHVPTTGIIDFTRVAEAYAAQVRNRGGEIRISTEVLAIVEDGGALIVQTSAGHYATKFVINCGGLHSDLLARMMPTTQATKNTRQEEHRIIPFRGEYYKILPQKKFLVRNLIYPVPDPAFPFLGVHFTRMMSGEIEAGPNAVLAFAREGYRKTDFSASDLWRIISYRGFWSMAQKYWRTGFGEMHRSLSKQAFVKALQRILPDITADDLIPGGAGVRAQAVSATGALADDFVVTRSERAIHVLNAPSPGATASLAIGSKIVEMAAESFSLK